MSKERWVQPQWEFGLRPDDAGQPRAHPVPLESSSLEDLEREARRCRRCGLRDGCRAVVFGEGDPQARLMLVGEGPGRVEDEMGRPFVGPAGQLLDRILAAAGFARAGVYITNSVKCRPPGNRLPTPAEREQCQYWLQGQLRLISPRVVVCLGSAASQTLVDSELRITQARGRWIRKGGLLLMPTYHPAALLRDPSKKRPVWVDFQAVRDVVLGVADPP